MKSVILSTTHVRQCIIQFPETLSLQKDNDSYEHYNQSLYSVNQINVRNFKISSKRNRNKKVGKPNKAADVLAAVFDARFDWG